VDAPAEPVVALFRSTLGSIVGYFAVVGLLFLLVWVWGERRFAARRIQPVKRFDGRQLRHELLHTLITFVVGLASAGATVGLHAAGRTRLVDEVAPGDELALVAWVLGIIAFNDAWFYFWHRLLHTPWIFRHVHAVHHRSVDVNPFSSYSFHAVESMILGAWVVPAALLLPVPLPALIAVQGIGLANNVNSHLGYEFLPRFWVELPPFSWMSSSTYHNLHHQKYRGNYGLFFRFWDRLLGTEIPGYEGLFLARRPRATRSTAPRADGAA